MPTTLTIRDCLARAHDLTNLADHEPSYELVLLYDDLAREWRRMALMIEASGRSPCQTYGDGSFSQIGGRHVSFRHD